MYLLFAALFCLTLGLINGDHLSTADKSVLMNDARRLLYVVGTYPEWQDKMRDFKKKWGKEGEKYLNQPNVYIHGDIMSSDERNAQNEKTPENEEQFRRRYSNFDMLSQSNELKTKNENLRKNLIKQKLERMMQKSEAHNDLFKVKSTPTRRFSSLDTTNATISKPKKTRRKLDSNKPKNNIKKKKINNTRRKALEDEDQLERKYPNNINKIYNGLSIGNNEDPKDLKQFENFVIKNEEPENTIGNEERRWPSNIHKMYSGIWSRNNDDPENLKKLDPLKETENPTTRFSNYQTTNTTTKLQNEPNNYANKQKFINTRIKALEHEGLTKEQLKRRYENIQKMYRGLLSNHKTENSHLTEDELHRKYSNVAKMYQDLFVDPNALLNLNITEDALQKKLNNIAKMYHELILKRRNHLNDTILENEDITKNGLQITKETKNVEYDDQLLQRRFNNVGRMYRGMWATRKNEDSTDPKTSENEDLTENKLRRGYPNIDKMYHSLLIRKNQNHDPNIIENKDEVKDRFNNGPRNLNHKESKTENEVQRKSFNDNSNDKEDQPEKRYESNADELYNSMYSRANLDQNLENFKRGNTHVRQLRPIRTKVYRFIHKIPEIRESDIPTAISSGKYIPKYIVKDLTMSDKSLEKLSHPTDMSYNNPSKNNMNKDYNSEYNTKDYIPKYIVKDLKISDKSLEKLSHPTDMSYNNPSKNKNKDYKSKNYKTKDYNSNDSEINDSEYNTKDYDSKDYDSKEYNAKDYKQKDKSKDRNKKDWYSEHFVTREDEINYLKEVVIPKILGRQWNDKPKVVEEKLPFSESMESTEMKRSEEISNNNNF